MVRCEVPGCTNERVMGWRPVGCPDRFRMVCRAHRRRHDDRNDAFDLHDVFGLPRSTGSDRTTDKAFPDFGHEVKRPHPVHDSCYDCAAFYDGCEGWRAAKEFHCGHYQRLPDVMPGTCGQPWPEKVFVPTNPNREGIRGDSGGEPAKQRPVPTKPKDSNGARHCDCGAPLAKGKQCCDTCRAQKRRQSKGRYMGNYMRERREGSTEPQTSPGRPQTGPQSAVRRRSPVGRTLG